MSGADQAATDDSASPHILWLSDPRCTQAELVGNKCATLARLKGSGYRVPDGFCIPSATLADGAGVYETPVTEALRQLKSPWVARSSSSAEDSSGLAFPGLFTTVLDLGDTHSLFMAIRKIGISTRSPVVRSYAEYHGVDPDTVSMAILVQSLVPATAAGVAFSRDPVSNAPNVVIEANYGLGETVVDGSITPDSFTVDGEGAVIDRRLGSKYQKVVTTTLDARVRRVDTSELERSSFTLEDESVIAVAEVTLRLEADLGYPVDVEWAFVGDQLHVLQARPITTADGGGTTEAPA
jgi:phosphoenolpyruvate synthase/pyruvate phosphate dikinase